MTARTNRDLRLPRRTNGPSGPLRKGDTFLTATTITLSAEGISQTGNFGKGWVVPHAWRFAIPFLQRFVKAP